MRMSEDKEVLDHLFKEKVKSKGGEVQPPFNIVFILDRSGSMAMMHDDVIGGTNTFIEEQKKEGGECYFSMVQFDSVYGDPAYWNKRIEEVDPLTKYTFIPRGATALYDAIGKTIAVVREKRASGEMTGKVQFIIQTDGAENSSKEFTAKEEIGKLIEQVKDEQWGDFLFLGTNFDAFAEGHGLNIDATRTVHYGSASTGVRGASYFASMHSKSFRYDSPLDEDTVEKMQESIASNVGVEDMYAQIDAAIDRSDKTSENK
jgi:hypothetical protein